jgi:uncharacterized membrane protein
MKKNTEFFSKTFKGGIFFVLPFALVVIILLKIIQILTPVATKLGSWIDPQSHIPFFSYIIVILIILMVFFLGGLYEIQFSTGKKLGVWIEDNLLSMLPAYQLIKKTSQEKIGFASDQNLKVVLVPTDGWAIGYLVEELSDEEVLVFLPSSPNHFEGSLNIFKRTEIKSTKLSIKDAQDILVHTGFGAKYIFEKSAIKEK